MNTFDILAYVFKQLPEDARDKKNRGVEYVIECPDCGGKIHVVHSLYNGHMHASCDGKCKFLVMEYNNCFNILKDCT